MENSYLYEFINLPHPDLSGWGRLISWLPNAFAAGRNSFRFPPAFHILQIISGFCVFVREFTLFLFCQTLTMLKKERQAYILHQVNLHNKVLSSSLCTEINVSEDTIRRDLQEGLAKEGYPVRVYVPFGTHWYPYFMRRLAERPANIWFFITNLFKG